MAPKRVRVSLNQKSEGPLPPPQVLTNVIQRPVSRIAADSSKESVGDASPPSTMSGAAPSGEMEIATPTTRRLQTLKPSKPVDVTAREKHVTSLADSVTSSCPAVVQDEPTTVTTTVKKAKGAVKRARSASVADEGADDANKSAAKTEAVETKGDRRATKGKAKAASVEKSEATKKDVKTTLAQRARKSPQKLSPKKRSNVQKKKKDAAKKKTKNVKNEGKTDEESTVLEEGYESDTSSSWAPSSSNGAGSSTDSEDMPLHVRFKPAQATGKQAVPKKAVASKSKTCVECDLVLSQWPYCGKTGAAHE